jgi:hypothetical protein
VFPDTTNDSFTSPLLIVFAIVLVVASWVLLADWRGASGWLVRRLDRAGGFGSYPNPLGLLPANRRGVLVLAGFAAVAAALCLAGAVAVG